MINTANGSADMLASSRPASRQGWACQVGWATASADAAARAIYRICAEASETSCSPVGTIMQTLPCNVVTMGRRNGHARLVDAWLLMGEAGFQVAFDAG
jgi:hypothetical protein